VANELFGHLEQFCNGVEKARHDDKQSTGIFVSVQKDKASQEQPKGMV
jgi:hypothetical protein